MTITAPGLYGLTLVKYLTNAAALDLGAEDLKAALVTDSYTPNFDTHALFSDVTNEVTGTGYTAGGATVSGTTVGVASGLLTFDAADPSWATSTIANAMGVVFYHDAVGDELVALLDFVSAASSSGGTFQVELSASGIFTLDYTP